MRPFQSGFPPPVSQYLSFVVHNKGETAKRCTIYLLAVSENIVPNMVVVLNVILKAIPLTVRQMDGRMHKRHFYL